MCTIAPLAAGHSRLRSCAPWRGMPPSRATGGWHGSSGSSAGGWDREDDDARTTIRRQRAGAEKPRDGRGSRGGQKRIEKRARKAPRAGKPTGEGDASVTRPTIADSAKTREILSRAYDDCQTARQLEDIHVELSAHIRIEPHSAELAYPTEGAVDALTLCWAEAFGKPDWQPVPPPTARLLQMRPQVGAVLNKRIAAPNSNTNV
eukprot:COSAG05_NODE_16_length_35726_cov_813.577584_1_plen_204_part_10